MKVPDGQTIEECIRDAPGEKLTDRHPDSVIAQVVEETIEKHNLDRAKFLATPIKVRSPYAPLPAQPEPAFRLFEQDGALYVDTKVRFAQPAPVSPDLLAHQDRLIRATHEAMDMPANVFRGVDRSATSEKLSGAVLANQRRPDGFDQHQVDAAKAALLAPAAPRYPRSR